MTDELDEQLGELAKKLLLELRDIKSEYKQYLLLKARLKEIIEYTVKRLSRTII